MEENAMIGRWRYLCASVLAGHGVIHIMGFAAVWRLASGAISSTPSIGGVPGSPMVLVLGLAWALVSLAFLASAAGLMARSSWWRRAAWGAALASLVLCVLWWRDASLGIGVDIVVMAVLVRVHPRPARRLAGQHPQVM
jgi:hypothetical protein